MQDFTNQLGFEYGYPDLDPAWYGLWSPRFDCFVMVHWDLDLLKNIHFLSSSKILTAIVELDKELYQKNIVDNTCCQNWTCLYPETTNFLALYKSISPRLPSSQIVPTQKDPDPEVFQMKIWLHYILYCIKKIHNHSIQSKVENLFDLEQSPDIKKQIYKLLLLTDDLTTAKKYISKILQDRA